jgi:ABC-type dipeptide/oligopeptide/nickel transport system ATPase component
MQFSFLMGLLAPDHLLSKEDFDENEIYASRCRDRAGASIIVLRGDGISIIFQVAMNALNPVRTTGDQIAETILKHIPSIPPGVVNDRVVELLNLVGIAPDIKIISRTNTPAGCVNGP